MSATEGAAFIELENVYVERAGVRVLDNVSLTLRAGDRLAVVGANGAGKTTLLRTITGLQKATSGTVRAFGRVRRTQEDFREVRIRAAYLFQDADDQLFCPTVLEDVAFGPLNMGLNEQAALEKANATLAFLGMEHLGERITRRLSGGEKRLVCLAGVLAMEPDVLLLDEPTNSLDAKHVEKLMTVLSSLDKSMIIVSHDRPILDRLATRAVRMKDCRLEPAVLHRHPHVHEHLHVHVGEDHA
ncbi:MAG: energy-coupling factor ABC transporter ATP-binding protein [Beijerinckiaceae bacterium]|jgi:cobalt/nickel transport system ATP-binding protein|nr:energy-coupling factor ABC transporter ATP-binding protein [Beijerinckiaceae bacterium]MDO9440762.1 ABC transporter ATP-binding protein [Beijerinckiaceae bacterium]